MTYLVFEITEPTERRDEYQEFLQLNAQGIQKSAEHLLRVLQLMAPQDKLYQHGVVFTLARHVAEEVDAIGILMEKGSVDPCKAHLRSAFEAELGIRYILTRDSERRAIAYHVKELREQLRANEKYDERTPVGKRIRDGMQADPIGKDVLSTLPEYDFDEENEKLRRVLQSPPYLEVNTEWDARGKRVAWHALFGGPRTIRDLAYDLDKGFWYEFLYSDWSGRIHAGRTLQNVAINSREPTRKGGAIRPIRHPEDMHNAYNFGLGLAVGVAHMLSQKYLTRIGQDDIRRFYLEQIRPINKRVQNVKIQAAWH